MMQEMQNPPTFLGIGVQKAATTWLARMVEQHPEVSLPQEKEVHFFNIVENYQKGILWYQDQFAATPKTKAIGEFTPNYFWTSPYKVLDREGIRLQNEQIPRLVHELLPDIQLIVCLRDPVDRAVSSYFHQIRAGNIKPTESILEAAPYHGIESMGYYDIHFTNWLKYFPLERFLILFYGVDIRDDTNKKKALKRVFQHINVDDTFEPTELTSQYNYRHTDFDMRLNHYPLPKFVRRRIKKHTPAQIKKMDLWKIKVRAAERAILRERFVPHNKRLEKILGR
ncbi:MAG: sulfotransferase domain-containing protein, partial [Anaerolineales bacterium]|nr:sulfotransferase domain-containing protein [Anaerolineales bacterium]